MPTTGPRVTAAERDPSVCVSVTLVHPANVVGQNEMPFGRDIRVVPDKTVLDRGTVPHGKRRFGGQNPQFAAVLPIAKLALVVLFVAVG